MELNDLGSTIFSSNEKLPIEASLLEIKLVRRIMGVEVTKGHLTKNENSSILRI